MVEPIRTVAVQVHDWYERLLALADPNRPGTSQEHGLTTVGSFLLRSVLLALLGVWVGH